MQEPKLDVSPYEKRLHGDVPSNACTRVTEGQRLESMIVLSSIKGAGSQLPQGLRRNLLHSAIAFEDVAASNMIRLAPSHNRPGGRRKRYDLYVSGHPAGGRRASRDIPIPAQECIDQFRQGVRAKEVTHLLIAEQRLKVCRSASREIAWTNQSLHAAQFIRNGPKVLISERAPLRAAARQRNVVNIGVPVVPRPHLHGHADLAKIVAPH